MSNINVSKGELKMKSSDGSEMTLGFVMPSDIASKISIDIMSWKDNWLATTSTVEEYQNTEKEFLLMKEDKEVSKIINYLYIALPRFTEIKKDFSLLKKGTSLEVRLNELNLEEINEIFSSIEKLNLNVELSFKKTTDAYGSIQIFTFS